MSEEISITAIVTAGILIALGMIFNTITRNAALSIERDNNIINHCKGVVNRVVVPGDNAEMQCVEAK